MEINIRFEATDPPTGFIGRDGDHDWLPFGGWLELIGALERHLDLAGSRSLEAEDDRPFPTHPLAIEGIEPVPDQPR